MCLETLSEVRVGDGCPSSPDRTAKGLQAHGSDVLNCRLSPKKKQRALLCGELPEGLCFVELGKLAGACGQSGGAMFLKLKGTGNL